MSSFPQKNGLLVISRVYNKTHVHIGVSFGRVILMGRFVFSTLLPFQHRHTHKHTLKLANNKGAVGDTEEVAKQQASSNLLYRGRSIGIPFGTPHVCYSSKMKRLTYLFLQCVKNNICLCLFLHSGDLPALIRRLARTKSSEIQLLLYFNTCSFA